MVETRVSQAVRPECERDFVCISAQQPLLFALLATGLPVPFCMSRHSRLHFSHHARLHSPLPRLR